MIKKLLATLIGLALLPVGLGLYLYATNTTPVVPAIQTADAAASTAPYVVKLHARWCSVCLITQGVWPQIQREYAGKVHLLVVDFTNGTTTAASRAEAKRLGLDAFLEEYDGVTGPIVVLDGKTKAVASEISGERSFGPYRDAIEAALQMTTH